MVFRPKRLDPQQAASIQPSFGAPWQLDKTSLPSPLPIFTDAISRQKESRQAVLFRGACQVQVPDRDGLSDAGVQVPGDREGVDRGEVRELGHTEQAGAPTTES